MTDQVTTTFSGPVLKVRDLTVHFGVDNVWVPAALKLNYSIERGKVLAIVGESGSGKSASSMAILDLLPENSRISGSVKLSGRELMGLKPAQMHKVRGGQIAMIFQEPMTALNPVYTIGFQIIETLRAHFGMSPSEAKARALELLDMVELPDPLKAFNSYPHQLSGGQRQRAMIAQSISCDPQLLIADEPTTALDVTVQAEILDLLRSLRDRLDSAILLITHDMGVVADLADDIAVMRRGVIVERGTVDQIFNEPTHPYTIALLQAVPHLGQRGDEAIDMTAALAIGTDIVVDAVLAARIEVNERLANEAASEARRDKREVVVKFDDVVIEYPKHGRVAAFRAVDKVNLFVRQGEVLGLVGESGSGKTTLGRAAIALLPITEGSLHVAGQDISKASRDEIHRLHKSVGIVFQDPSSSLNPRMPIGDSIGEPLKLAKGLKGAGLSAEVERLLDSVELPRAYRSRFPHELSGGQKQRVGIARALSLEPKVLIADEPTSALDVSVQARVLQLIQSLQQQMNFACLFITHDLAVIDVLADRIAVMHHGRIVETGTRDEILRYPKDPYTQRLLAAVPIPDPTEQRARRELRRELLASGIND
ncbi:ABC transporter ATP-binding protein [Cryobacterium sp. TMT1-3]|uniref:ABC transporter ATP-binding protein n=1 Tax=Cryobacterium luteum TaxID=1424661 RepID=A0A1H8E123_9MICO|nr:MULTISPECIES: ABC transporter ATP-binding protein [Cryobacterium]TFB89766.1 ABC transporter ATP-binding protein [Cryobacterium luteum]TFC25478.1 ABC transporter ATP-binding protein [Cryobacterium sp. TMT1-3]SEN12497.1 peptide/nickel transport system ATP-binding protein [Cryobacterium luteum]